MLTYTDIFLRHLKTSGDNQKMAAEKLGVSTSAINQLIHGTQRASEKLAYSFIERYAPEEDWVKLKTLWLKEHETVQRQDSLVSFTLRAFRLVAGFGVTKFSQVSGLSIHQITTSEDRFGWAPEKCRRKYEETLNREVELTSEQLEQLQEIHQKYSKELILIASFQVQDKLKSTPEE